MLFWEEGLHRQALLTKSPTMPASTATYCVCQKGIRDVSPAIQAVSAVCCVLYMSHVSHTGGQEIAERKRKYVQVEASPSSNI